MAQGDKTTQKGLGGPSPHSDQRTSEVPTSHQRENVRNGSATASDAPPVSDPTASERTSGPVAKATQPGMPIAPDRKVVTKVGIAPPSDPPPPPDPSELQAVGKAVASMRPGDDPDPYRTNPGFTPPPPLETLQFEPSEEERQRMSSPDDLTPDDERSMSEDELDDRSRFKTAPGGGRNRVSGGRAHAAAYVSPSTLPPGHGSDHITSAIKVDEVVRNAVRAYETEPSLLRRRASSLPPVPQVSPRRALSLALGAGVIGLVMGAVLLWAAMGGFRRTEDAEGGVAQVGSSRPDVADTDGAESDRAASDTPAAPAELPEHPALQPEISPEEPETSLSERSAVPSTGPASKSTEAPVSDQKSAASAPTPARTEPTRAATPSPALESKAASPPQPRPAAAPQPAPAPQPSSGKDPSNDLWLE